MKLKNNKKVRVVEGNIVYQIGNDWSVSKYHLPVNHYCSPEECIHNDATPVDELLRFFNNNSGIADIVYSFDLQVDEWLCGCNEWDIIGFHSVSFSNDVGMLQGGFHNELFKQPRFRNQLDAIKSIATIQLKDVA